MTSQAPQDSENNALAATSASPVLVLGVVGKGLLLGAGAVLVCSAILSPWLMIPAAALAVGAGVVFIVRAALAASKEPALPQGLADAGAARIGLGAEVNASARIDPGAVVEMGATIEADAVVETGALVRMGATVHRGAVVESGAVVGWGAEIHEGARVSRQASVGAGATVGKGAVVPVGGHLGAGGTMRASSAPQAPRTDAPLEGKARQLEEVCDRMESELKRGSPALRQFLSTTDSSVEDLRRVCRELLTRERGLRQEVSPELLNRLAQERAQLEQRYNEAQDEAVRGSLQRALLALDDQKAQRETLARNADRLDAELVRLRWSIESITSQLVQVRTHGAESSPPALEQSLGQIKQELAAVAEALVATDREERASLQHEPFDDVSPRTRNSINIKGT